ncbi:MAG: hypothetical protein EXS03_09515 [Phycisphaerales bacterium]|nr:hypothetical protein [Phycisphaerales bacterium]
MAKAYTPGLKVTPRTTYQARRLLPVPGTVKVKHGDRVTADMVVAETFLEGDVFPIKLAAMLGVNPRELPELMLKKTGDQVAVGDPLARTKGIFGMMKTEAKSSAAGVLESVSDSTGMVIIRGPQPAVQVRAYVAGTVVEVIAREGVVVETSAVYAQGIFGVGGEIWGPLVVAATGHNADLLEGDITESMKGAIVLGGARMTAGAIRRAREVGVAAVISGGIDDADLRDVLGYDLGVAVTGSEKLGITLLVTEGFGDIAMARRTYDLLAATAGRMASVNGATQIRAGVMRPEIVVPIDGGGTGEVFGGGATAGLLEVGTRVRIIRDPHFGVLGTVSALPEQPAVLGSGSKARVLEVAIEDGSRVTVPRANVELFGE